MSKICSKCGKENRDNMTYCAECGEKLPSTAPAVDEFEVEPTMRAMPSQSKKPEQVKAPEPKPMKAAKPAKEKAAPVTYAGYEAPGTVKFLTYRIIFAIPFFGWLMAFVLSFVGKDKALKSYARATLVWIVVWLLVFVGIVIFVNSLVNDAVAQAGVVANGLRDKLQYFFDILSQWIGGNSTITIG